MKLWRTLRAQKAFRTEVNEARKLTMGERFEAFLGRIGRMLKANTATTKVSFPSPLLQRLMLRGGYWHMPEGVEP
jgi:hypothetical protein